MGHSPDGTGQITDNGKEARGQRFRLLNCRNHLGAGEHRGPWAETAGSLGWHRWAAEDTAGFQVGLTPRDSGHAAG